MKPINFDVELKSTSLQRQFTREKAMTNDLNSVDINYKILDMAAKELTDATAQVLLYMQDGSFFQVPNEKITLAGTTFTYALEEAPGNHAGIVRTQVVVKTADLKEYASPKFEFEIVSGLETTVATEVMIHDWTTLTREARAYLDEAIPNEQTRIENELARAEAEIIRAQDAEDFAEAEALRVQAEGLRVEAERLRVLAENLREQDETARQQVFDQSQIDRQAAYLDAEIARNELYSLAESNRNLRVVAIENRQIVTDPNGNRFFISLEVYDGKPRLKLEEVI